LKHKIKDKRFKQADAGHALTYFVMYIFATGIIDDLESCIKELTKVIHLPLSIIIVQLKNDSLRKDDIDVCNLEQKCNFLFQRANRKFLKVIKYRDLGFTDMLPRGSARSEYRERSRSNSGSRSSFVVQGGGAELVDNAQLEDGFGVTNRVQNKLTAGLPFEIEQYFDSISPHREELKLKL